jgi:hypothetical protein
MGAVHLMHLLLLLLLVEVETSLKQPLPIDTPRLVARIVARIVVRAQPALLPVHMLYCPKAKPILQQPLQATCTHLVCLAAGPARPVCCQAAVQVVWA